jgi:hypothetical protein
MIEHLNRTKLFARRDPVIIKPTSKKRVVSVKENGYTSDGAELLPIFSPKKRSKKEKEELNIKSAQV